MKIRLADNLMQKLSELGQAIDIGRQTLVFDGGEVGIVDDPNAKESENESDGTRGPAAGSRAWPQAGARTAGQAPRLRRVAEQAAGLAGIDALRSAYPTLVREGDFGLWVIVKSKPLGLDGPQVTFVIAYPYRSDVDPKAWAFWTVGRAPAFIGPRHTNFPDASICAFGPQDGVGRREDGILSLVDLYSTWVVRQLYFQSFALWPGKQHGLSALYRRKEFAAGEWCGCGSGLRYRECHQGRDLLLSEEAAREDHRRIFDADYGPRHPPKSILKFVRSRWKQIPSFKAAYEGK